MRGAEARQLKPPAWRFGEAMNLFGRGVIALDSIGFVLDANATARAFFDDEVQVSERRLRLRDSRASADFAILTARLRAAPERAELHVTPIVARRTAKPPLLLRLFPVGGAATRTFLDARALVLLSELRAKPAPDPSVLARAFGLSRAEARLAALVANGLAPAAAAQRLGISRETARSQLRAVFAKTATHRQSELAALLASLS
jgi:DNA-binding CsgD family transcriptional regulator